LKRPNEQSKGLLSRNGNVKRTDKRRSKSVDGKLRKRLPRKSSLRLMSWPRNKRLRKQLQRRRNNRQKPLPRSERKPQPQKSSLRRSGNKSKRRPERKPRQQPKSVRKLARKNWQLIANVRQNHNPRIQNVQSLDQSHANQRLTPSNGKSSPFQSTTHYGKIPESQVQL
jgi:hypothetical protein